MDEDPMMFANDDAVGLAVGGAFGAGVIKADLGHSVDDRHAVGLFLMGVPGFNHAWVDGAEVGLAESNKVGVVFSEDLHDAASVIAVLREGENFQAVDHEVSMEDWRGVERLRCGANEGFRSRSCGIPHAREILDSGGFYRAEGRAAQGGFGGRGVSPQLRDTLTHRIRQDETLARIRTGGLTGGQVCGKFPPWLE